MAKNKRVLVCNNCGGVYELKIDESPDDFTVCECGGSLKYVEKFENSINSTKTLEDTPSDTLEFCPECGTPKKSYSKFCKICGKEFKAPENPSGKLKCKNCGFINEVNADFCQECGSTLKTSHPSIKLCPYCGEEINSKAIKCKHCGEWLDKGVAKKNKSNVESFGNIDWSLINWKAIIIGEFSLIFLNYVMYTTLTGPGGLVFVIVFFASMIIPMIITGFISGNDFRSAIINSVIVGVIYCILMGIWYGLESFKATILILPIIGIIGGPIGFVIYEMYTKREQQ